MSLLNIITEHGDLTDIAFLEKTLGTKLSPLPFNGLGTPDPDDITYNGDQVRGSPIYVQVSVTKGKDIQARSGAIAEVWFRPLSQALFTNCLKLTTTDFVSVFGRPTFIWDGGRYVGGDVTVKLKFLQKNGAKLEVQYSYTCYFPSVPRFQYGLVNDARIRELP
jgi:hypothetical protein